MLADITLKQADLAAICRRYDVARLEVFGSAAREVDFDPATSDVDFLVEFKNKDQWPAMQQYLGLVEALEKLLGRSVDLVDRKALEASRNYIRRRNILKDAAVVYGE